MTITRLKYGNTNTFFLKGDSAGLLVDTDWAGTLPLFYKAIKENNIRLSDIHYVLATHYHPDHMGLASELMAAGVTLIVMDVQRDYTHFSDAYLSRGKRDYAPINDARAMYIACRQSRQLLASLGIKGEILHTPGHSEDSVSLIADADFAIVGDLPAVALVDAYADHQQLKESWKSILSFNPKTIYYSHY